MDKWKRADPVGALRTEEQCRNHQGVLYVVLPHLYRRSDQYNFIIKAYWRDNAFCLIDRIIKDMPNSPYHKFSLFDANIESSSPYNDNLVFANYWHAWAYAHVCGELYK